MYSLTKAAFAATLAVLGSAPAASMVAQTVPAGFGPGAAARQLEFERALDTTVSSVRLRQHLDSLTSRVRVAGTPAQIASADYVLRELASYGFDTARVEYRVYLPVPESTYVDRLQPRFAKLPLRLLLNEIPVKGDSLTDAQVWRAMAAYGGGGDTSGPLIFANFGRAEDYRTLDSMGVDVHGSVALVRLGHGRPGEKALAAERAGAGALVLYSDPADDGFFRGDPFPVGPMRPPDGVERVSLDLRPGDPSTPGWASAAGARRLPRDSMALPRIPVVPVSYRNAMHLLPALGGPSVPQAWQGGLPMRYHLGGDTTAVVRVAVWPETGERAYKTIVNTVAVLRGAELPDEVVLAGAHRDAWGRGAADNASGVATLLEAARQLGADARAGRPPRRTVMVATWDASEWGQVGATEYAEQLDDRQRDGIVAYVDHDVTVSGSTFSGSSDRALAQLLVDATGAVRAPRRPGSILDGWRDPGVRAEASASPRPSLPTDCGDCRPWREVVGVPALEFGFRDPSGLLRSAYDGPPFLARADSGWLAHAAAARLSAVVLSRLADATLPAVDYVALARGWAEAVGAERGARAGNSSHGGEPAYSALVRALAELEREAQAWREARDAALKQDRSLPLDARRRIATGAGRRAIDRVARDGASATADMFQDAARQVEAVARELARTRKALR